MVYFKQHLARTDGDRSGPLRCSPSAALSGSAGLATVPARILGVLASTTSQAISDLSMNGSGGSSRRPHELRTAHDRIPAPRIVRPSLSGRRQRSGFPPALRRRQGAARHVLTVRKVVPIPYNAATGARTGLPANQVHRSASRRGVRTGPGYRQVHCHGIDYRRFSPTDDNSDRTLFSAVTSLLDDALPHASLVCSGWRAVRADDRRRRRFDRSVSSIMVVGNDIRVWTDRRRAQSSFSLRHAQAFGGGTTEIRGPFPSR